MGSLGELFVQLAFEGDTSKANEFINKTKQIIKLSDEQIKKNKLLIQYLKDLKEAQTDAQKKLIKDNFAKEIKKLNLEKSLNKTTEAQNKNNMAVKSAVGNFVKLAATISGVAYAVKRLTDSLISENQEFLNLTRTSDVALSTFQKWNSVGEMLGVKNAEQQIKSLNDRIFELKLTGANASGFMLAGIKPTNAEDVMEQLRGRVAGLNDNAASYLLRQLGLDPSMLHLLRMQRAEFEALNKTTSKYRLNEDQSKEIQKLNIQIQIANQKLQYMKDRVVLAMLPYWVKFLNLISETAVKVGGFIHRIEKMNPKLKTAVKWVIGITTAAFALSKVIGLVKTAAVGLGVVLNALKFNPIYLGITLLIGALALLADDIRAYTQGYDSGIGYILKFFENFNNMPFNDFIDKLEKVLNHPVPEWMKVLLKLSKDGINLPKDVQEEQENLAKTPYTADTARENLKNASNKSLGEKLADADRFLQFYFTEGGIFKMLGDTWTKWNAEYLARQQAENKIREQINNSNNNLSVNQINNIQTNQPIATIRNNLGDALAFANYNSQYQAV